MSKLTQVKFNEYKAVNENGFKVDLGKIMHQFAHGDEYPQLRQMIYNDDNTQIIITVSFFKYYNSNASYTIIAEQFAKSKDGNIFMIGGTGYYNKELFKEEIKAPARFNFKHLKELCNTIDIEDIKAEILTEYEKYKALKTKKTIHKVQPCHQTIFYGIVCLESDDEYGFFKNNNDVRPSQCTWIKKEKAEKLYRVITGKDNIDANEIMYKPNPWLRGQRWPLPHLQNKI